MHCKTALPLIKVKLKVKRKREYRGQLEELIICIQQIAIEWQTLKDMLDAREWSPNAYRRAIAVPTGARGRPSRVSNKISEVWPEIRIILKSGPR